MILELESKKKDETKLPDFGCDSGARPLDGGYGLGYGVFGPWTTGGSGRY